MPGLSLVYERKTSPWIILCMKALERQTGCSGYLEGQGSGVKLFPRRLQPVPRGKPPAAPRRGGRRGAQGTLTRRRRPALPAHALAAPGGTAGAGGEPGNPPAEPRSGRQSQRWGMPRHGAGVPGCTGSVLGAGQKITRRESGSGLWLGWGCGEAWLVRRLPEQPFLGIFCLGRVRRGWAVILGIHGPARLPHGNRGAHLGACLAPP